MPTRETEGAPIENADDLFVRDTAQLAELCERALRDGEIGLDTEFIPERTYYPQLALVQLAVGETLRLVDPLAGFSLRPLEELLLDERVAVVLHGGEQDLGIFHHRLGRPVVNVYDTQVACAFTGMGTQISYGNMVSELLGERLEKGEAYTDWLRRPLSERQVRYALDDVRYLLPCRRRLREALCDKGREEWVMEELRRYDDPSHFELPLEEAHRKVRKAGGIRGRNRGALEALAAWREEEARRADVPRRRVISDEVLVALAGAAPDSAEKLKRFRGLNPRAEKKHGRDIVQAIRRGLSQGASGAGPARKGTSPRVKIASDILQICLHAIADAEAVTSSYLASRRELEALVEDFLTGTLDPSTHKVLEGWRGELAGKELLACLEGQVCLGLDPVSGEVVFVGGGSAVPQKGGA